MKPGRYVLALALAAIAVWTPPEAMASTLMDPPAGSFPYQRWVDRAKVPTPDVRLRLFEAPCPFELAQEFANACTGKGTFEIWMNAEGGTRERFYHELGHNLDYYELGRWASRQFRKIVGDDRPWRTKPGEVGLSPHEIFAEAYAQCARKEHIKRAIIQLPPIVIGPREHDLICALIRESYQPDLPRPPAGD
jgi:hypothetical protein